MRRICSFIPTNTLSSEPTFRASAPRTATGASRSEDLWARHPFIVGVTPGITGWRGHPSTPLGK